MRLLITGAFVWALSSAPIALASTFGPVENFDVVNDTGKVAHGFEIELHGIHSSDITSIFGDASRWPDMERYGAPTVTEYSDAQYGVSTRITYRAGLNGSNWSAGAPSGTLPVNPSDSCWPYGDPNYGPNFPCDHFGVSTSVPAASVKYSWLVEQTPGSSSLVYAESSVPAPVWTITPQPPVNNVPQPPAVAVHIEAPEAKPGFEFGEAKWAKVTASGTLNDVAVEDLMKENQVVKDAQQQVQVEWQLIQKDAGNPNSGQIDLTGVALDREAKGVVYTFEYYQYSGAYDAETHEAKPRTSDTPAQPDPTDLGMFLVAQMAAVNFDGQVPPVAQPPVAPILDAVLTDGVIGTFYSAVVVATPAAPGDTLSYSATGLPDGLGIDQNSGAISGIPSAIGGPFTVTITVNDLTNGTSSTTTTTMSVTDAVITFAPENQTGTVAVPFSYTLGATGGTGVFTYAYSGTLPDGLVFDNAAGVISGTPTVGGSVDLWVSATDTAPNAMPSEAPLNITINETIAATPCSGSATAISNMANRGVWFEVDGGIQPEHDCPRRYFDNDGKDGKEHSER